MIQRKPKHKSLKLIVSLMLVMTVMSCSNGLPVKFLFNPESNINNIDTDITSESPTTDLDSPSEIMNETNQPDEFHGTEIGNPKEETQDQYGDSNQFPGNENNGPEGMQLPACHLIEVSPNLETSFLRINDGIGKIEITINTLIESVSTDSIVITNESTGSDSIDDIALNADIEIDGNIIIITSDEFEVDQDYKLVILIGGIECIQGLEQTLPIVIKFETKAGLTKHINQTMMNNPLNSPIAQ